MNTQVSQINSELQSEQSNTQPHDSKDLVHVFNQCFSVTKNTVLVANGDEPIYLPCDETTKHNRIIFTRDYFASALHEISHWCIAGNERRKKVDFGYWYAPDGRTQEQQTLFEKVEIKPQAIEWIFSQACAAPFRVSADNLSMGLGASLEFKRNIAAQARDYCVYGLPDDAKTFMQALEGFYQTENSLQAKFYSESFL
ncbi:elongation factor P hydroxylase [Sessilibacter corallicola]|uniref:elongation factor P hydroxylase n=1 Tax=Sessilibacter corallicola TaxID=2904075 RepID=UPI003D9C770A